MGLKQSIVRWSHSKTRSVLGVVLLSIVCALRPVSAAGAGLVCDLSACLDYALVSHPSLKLAKAKQSTAETTVSMGQSKFWPTLDVSTHAGVVYGEPASPFILARSITVKTVDFFGSYYSLDVEYRHPFYKEGVWFGKDAPSILEAKGALRESEYAVMIAREQLRYEVSEAYFNALKAKEALQAGEDLLRARQLDYEAAQKRFTQRLLTRHDLLLAEVKQKAAQNNLDAAKRAFSLARTNLAFRVGLDPGTEIEVRPHAMPLSPIPPLDVLTEMAYRERPEIAEQMAAVETTAATLQLAQSEGLPTLELISGYSIGDDYDPPGNTSWVTTFQVNLPLQNLYTSRVKRLQAETKRLEQDQRRLELRHTVASEVMQAYHEVAKRVDALELAVIQVEQAEQEVASVRSKFDAGLATQPALFEAEYALSEAKKSRTDVQYDQYIAHAKLRKAVGGAWTP